MANENKVNFGLRNVHYALITYTNGVPSWGTPKPWKGGVNVTLTKETSSSDFYADDTKFFHITANNGYTGSIEMARVTEEVLKDLFGYTETTTGKLIVEDANATPVEFALMFEVQGDEQPTRYCLYRCTADRPDINAATKADSVEVQTQTCDLVVMPVIDPTANSPIDGITKYSTGANTPSATYESFFGAVDTTLA